MATYQNSSFSNETIELDDAVFRDCAFQDCVLTFSARGPTELSGCTFARSKLVPGGAAQLTLTYLRGFYQGLGDWGRETVEQLFETVRGPGSSRATPRTPEPGDADHAALEAFGATREGRAIARGFQHLSPDHRRQIAELIARAAGLGA
ncbi:MAG TPA: hypothetical protein VHY32_05385 [Caulobacteraceae bacterium]|jgi:hypothetical protein|nr:hypothetical protein [Caulobacteraceae bacterium]